MAFRPQESSFVKDWQSYRLFAYRLRRRTRVGAVSLGCSHDMDKVRGMLSIRVGFLLASLNAHYALLG